MDTKNIKVEYKSTQLISILSQNFSGKMNLARIKFLGLFTEGGNYKGEVHEKAEMRIADSDRHFLLSILNTDFIRVMETFGIQTQGGWFWGILLPNGKYGFKSA